MGGSQSQDKLPGDRERMQPQSLDASGLSGITASSIRDGTAIKGHHFSLPLRLARQVSPSNPNAKPHFLTLPGEIRNKIYEYTYLLSRRESSIFTPAIGLASSCSSIHSNDHETDTESIEPEPEPEREPDPRLTPDFILDASGIHWMNVPRFDLILVNKQVHTECLSAVSPLCCFQITTSPPPRPESPESGLEQATDARNKAEVPDMLLRHASLCQQASRIIVTISPRSPDLDEDSDYDLVSQVDGSRDSMDEADEILSRPTMFIPPTPVSPGSALVALAMAASVAGSQDKSWLKSQQLPEIACILEMYPKIMEVTVRMLVLDILPSEVSVLRGFFGIVKRSQGRMALRLELSDFGTNDPRDAEVFLSEQEEFEDVLEALMGRFGGLEDEIRVEWNIIA